jgi:hypothetical protein
LIGIEVWFKVRENVNCFVWMQITLEATHHGPITNKPTMFLEIGEFLSLFLLSELISSLLALLKLPFRCVSEFLSSSPV